MHTTYMKYIPSAAPPPYVGVYGPYFVCVWIIVIIYLITLIYYLITFIYYVIMLMISSI